MAVKSFPLDLTPEQAAEFASGLARLGSLDLSHPSLIVPTAAGSEGSTAYLVEDYFAADSIDIAVRQYGPAPVPDAVRLIGQLAGGLDFAAAAGVHHGALHPRDILVAPREVRMTGIGVAAALEAVGGRAPIRRPYAAPERVAGGEWGLPADIFSLAAMAFELLTGRRPAVDGDRVRVDPDAIAAADGAALAEAFARSFSPQPADRHPSALAFAAALKYALTGQPLAPSGEAPRSRKRRAPKSEAETGPGELLPVPAAGVAETEPVTVPPSEPSTPLDEGTRDAGMRDGEVQGAQAVPPPPVDEPVLRPAPPDDLPLAVHEPPPLMSFEPEAPPPVMSLEPEAPPPVMSFEPEAPPPVMSFEPEAPPPLMSFESEAPPPVEDEPLADFSPAQAEYDRAEPGAAKKPPAVPVPPAFDTPPFRQRPMPDVPPRRRSAVSAVALVTMLAVGVLLGLAAGYYFSMQTPTPDTPPASEGHQPGTAPAQAAEPVPDGSLAPIPAAPLSGGAPSGRTNDSAAAAAGSSAGPAQPLSPEPARPKAPPSRSKASPEPARPTATPGRDARRERGATTNRPSPRAPAAAERARETVFQGALEVASKPASARVYLDGRLMGTTPLTLPSVAAGSHVIRLERDGYLPWSSGIQVVAGEQNRVTASLEQRSSRAR